MENHSTKLLNYVHENAEMGVQTITKILECIDGCALDALLARQLEQYHAFKAEAQEQLSKYGVDVKHVPKVTAFMSDMMINFKTMKDCSCNKIVEMMLQGTTMGIINAAKTIKQADDADEATLDLISRLLKFEEEQFENLKQVLINPSQA